MSNVRGSKDILKDYRSNKQAFQFEKADTTMNPSHGLRFRANARMHHDRKSEYYVESNYFQRAAASDNRARVLYQGRSIKRSTDNRRTECPENMLRSFLGTPSLP